MNNLRGILFSIEKKIFLLFLSFVYEADLYLERKGNFGSTF